MYENKVDFEPTGAGRNTPSGLLWFSACGTISSSPPVTGRVLFVRSALFHIRVAAFYAQTPAKFICFFWQSNNPPLLHDEHFPVNWKFIHKKRMIIFTTQRKSKMGLSSESVFNPLEHTPNRKYRVHGRIHFSIPQKCIAFFLIRIEVFLIAPSIYKCTLLHSLAAARFSSFAFFSASAACFFSCSFFSAAWRAARLTSYGCWRHSAWRTLLREAGWLPLLLSRAQLLA